MRKFTNQRGLAVLEVVIVAAIVAIFATAAVPRMARIYDKVQLDYEMKYLYSTLELGRSISKSSSRNPSIFGGKIGEPPQFYVYPDTNKYQLGVNITKSGTSGFYPVREHQIDSTIKIAKDFAESSLIISPDSGKSTTFTLTSKFAKPAYVIGNTVGRWRGTYQK